MYTNMVSFIDGEPDILAREAEGCPCHREIMASMSGYRRQPLLERYFGAGIKTCPMAGTLLPGFTAGELEENRGRMWGQLESV